MSLEMASHSLSFMDMDIKFITSTPLPWASLYHRFERMFSLDIRSLAIFRISISLILFWDLLMQLQDVSAFFTGDGAIPRIALSGNLGFIDFHALNENLEYQLILILLAAIVYFALLIGYKTRFAIILTWLFQISVQNRNPLILSSGDVLLRVLLFWSIFLPIGDYYSIDSFKKNIARKTYAVSSLGTVAFILQMFIVYVFAALLKTGIQWHQQGSAVYYALRLEQLATPFTSYLLAAPSWILIFLTHAIWFIELLCPFLFFFPIFSQQCRTIAVFIFISMHLGLGTFLNLGTFLWIPIFGLLAMLPTWFWDTVVMLFKKYRSQKLISEYRTVSCALPEPEEKNEKYIKTVSNIGVNIIVIEFIFLVILWNIALVPSTSFARLPVFFTMAKILRLEQYWSMFAPSPPTDDGWYVVPATLANGTTRDLFTQRPVTWEKPSRISDMYQDERWYKYMTNLWNKSDSMYRPYFLSYLCRRWNNVHKSSEQALYIKLYFMLKKLPQPFADPNTPTTKIFLLSQPCMLDHL